MNEMFSQGGKGSTGILTNKQAIARHFGIKQSEVVYFSVGVNLGGYKVIYDKDSQRAYSLPPGLASGTTAISLSTAAVLVHSAGNVDLGALAVSREEYVTLPGSFDSGSTINVKNELLTYTDGKYRWDGALPKTVVAGSTPSTTGGVNSDAWLSVGDASLRSNLSSDDGLKLIGMVSSIDGLRSVEPKSDGQLIGVKSYYDNGGSGGGVFKAVMSATSYTDDDGVTIKTAGGNAWVRQYHGSMKAVFFGVKGDGNADDTLKFIKATNSARSAKINLDISDLKIVLRTLSSPINLDGFWIVGNGVPSALPALYSDYINGADHADSVWDQEKLFVGSAIYCPANTAIFTGKSFTVRDVLLVGNYNQTGSTGFLQSIVTAYPGWSRALEGTRVTIHYFGGFGIKLLGGLEVCNVSHIKVAFTKNNCLNVSTTVGIDSPIEYLDFNETCYFMYSAVNNVLLDGFRKHVNFNGVLLNGAGQYDVKKAADPLFHLTNPVDALSAVSIVCQSSGAFGLHMSDCYAEVCHNLLTTSGGYITDIELRNSTNYWVDPAWPKTHLIVYNGASQISTSGNQYQDGKCYIYLETNVPANLIAADFGEESLGLLVQTGAKPLDNYRIMPGFSSGRFDIGDGTGGTATLNLQSLYPLLSNSENSSAKVLMFSLTSTHQFTGFDQLGAYILFATRLQSGNWKATTLATSDITGFASLPALSTAGVLSVNLTAGYRAALTRIDRLPF